ncbi:MAG: hypothetical protein B7Y85_03220 [Brevundimonas sp. 32-68-21]|nr:MAG: hypothetical protein B7Y85_03220 [Brevundimonas sp. 32-68-21]
MVVRLRPSKSEPKVLDRSAVTRMRGLKVKPPSGLRSSGRPLDQSTLEGALAAWTTGRGAAAAAGAGVPAAAGAAAAV